MRPASRAQRAYQKPDLVTDRLGHGRAGARRRPGTREVPQEQVTAIRRGIGHTDVVTTREQVHQIVDELADEQAAQALVLLRTVAGDLAVPVGHRRAPASLGIGYSVRGELSEHVDEMLAEGFGR